MHSPQNSIDLETLNPTNEHDVLSSSRGAKPAAQDPSAKYERMLSDGPFGTPEHVARNSGSVKLGSSIGLGGSIKLLRSAKDLIAAQTRRVEQAVKHGRRVEAAARLPPPKLADSGRSALSREEARLQDQVKNLEARAADAEVTEDQGMLGTP